ncbi:nitroreductase family protein [Symbiobacterium thermophilum]|uniref:NAD(P)H nitroreductase n=1 Tax=Symbiobacterium thermophilum (strain DSM 24528 / JCM 14929 / IAM 14863 / T) TaxID=292459 RepID=Q67QJ5_SYMTH|nr:nitroreductase family protein [Symbiobacterium thermophilum]BAD40048.1 NAD(P)H nitroreductase [Symbiobacterium thermophilum IAM 14863]
MTELPQNPCDVLEAIARRHSVREFRPDPVSEQVLLQLLEAARQAPSAMNLQPWEFVVVRRPETKARLAAATAGRNAQVVQTAGASVVCLASLRQADALADRIEGQIRAGQAPPDREAMVRRLREDQAYRQLLVLPNTYTAVGFLLLAATRLGLATLWMTGFDGEKVKEAVGAPAQDSLFAGVVAVGYPAEGWQQPARTRRPLEEIYSFERFGEK